MNFCSTTMINYTRERHTRVVTHDKNILRFPCPYDGNFVKEFTLLSSINPFQLNRTCWNWFTCLIVLNINFQNLRFCNIKWKQSRNNQNVTFGYVSGWIFHPSTVTGEENGRSNSTSSSSKTTISFCFSSVKPEYISLTTYTAKHICANASVGRAYALLLDSLPATHAVQYMHVADALRVITGHTTI